MLCDVDSFGELFTKTFNDANDERVAHKERALVIARTRSVIIREHVETLELKRC